MKENIRGALLVLFAILFIWFIAEGDLLESLSTTGWNGRSVGDLLKLALPTLLQIVCVIVALTVLANFGRLARAVCDLASYRKQIGLENFVGSLRIFCGGVGLLTLFVLALVALVGGTEGGLFAGSMSVLVNRFGKFAFFLFCLWGLLPAWRDYSEENAKECLRRREMLGRQQDPDWWNRRSSHQSSPKEREPM